jgi:acetyltransferase
LNNLIEGGYAKKGKIFPINPGAQSILGYTAYASVLDVPEPIDLAVMVIPYAHVPDALRECGQKGIPAVIVISAGFREAGRDGLEREHELVEIARQYQMRLVGPNCLGVIDTHTPLNASFAAGSPPSGPMAFMSQSGALGTAVLDIALAGRLGFSKFVSLGNKADVSEIDLLQAWKDDEQSKVILIYSEGMRNGQEFIQIARQVTPIKPIVAIKSGVTQAGSRAVSSHTGSLAGSEQAYQAAFQQAGILRADSMEALFDSALALGYCPPLKGEGIAILTNAGGPGILATDALERAGMALSRLDYETIRALEEYLPVAASTANPIDIRRWRADAVCPRKINNDQVWMAFWSYSRPRQWQRSTPLQGDRRSFSGATNQSWHVHGGNAKAGEILTRSGVPIQPRAGGSPAAMADYRLIRLRPMPDIPNFTVDKETVRRVIDQVRLEGRLAIGDAEARAVLQAYDLQIPKSELAETPEQAVKIANRLGYPVVLKIASPDILHKTDVGGVKVGLSNTSDVRDAFELMVYRAERYVPGGAHLGLPGTGDDARWWD